MRAAGSWVEWPGGESRPDVADTKMSGEDPQLHPCFPLQKFPALSLTRSFPPECPFQLPSSSAHLPVPTHSLHHSPHRSANVHGPALLPVPVMGITTAEPVAVSLSPLQPPLHAAAEPGHGREAELPALLQNQVLLASSEVLPLVQKLQDQQTQAGRNLELRSPGSTEKPSPAGLSPCGHIQTDTAIPRVPPTLPRHSRANPVPTFAGGGGEAGSQGDDDGKRGCQIPLCPCHGAKGATRRGTGPPRLSQHLCERATSAQSYGTRRLMQRHFAHIARSHTGERAGREQPARHRSQANGLGGLCSEPPFPHHARSLYPDPASGLTLPLPTFPHPPRPREAPTVPPASCAPIPLLSSQWPRRGANLQPSGELCNRSGSDVKGMGLPVPPGVHRVENLL